MFKAVAILVFAVLLAGCSPSDAPPTAAATETVPQSVASPDPTETPGTNTRPVITIGADPWCPHNCKAGSDQEGYMLDIAREVFEEAGFEVDYLNVSWARALQMTREGLLDAVVGAFVSDAPDFVFPSEPQGSSKIAMYTPRDSNWVFSGLDSLTDQTVLAINGYSYSEELDHYIASHVNEPARVWMLSGPSPLNRAIHLLDQHRADVFPEDVYVMTWAQKAITDVQPLRRGGVLQRNDIYIAFAPEKTASGELADLLAQGTVRLRESGRMDQILADYGLSEDE